MPQDQKYTTFQDKDGVALSLPKSLFYEEDPLSKSISPVACFDPESVLDGKGWQSATAPSKQPNKKTIIFDRSCIPHSITYSENIALITRLQNAGFKVLLCCNEGGVNSFVEVDEKTKLYDQFKKLGRFDQKRDFASLAQKQIARDKVVALNYESRSEILNYLVDDLAYVSKESVVVADEMNCVFDVVSDEEIEEFLKKTFFLNNEVAWEMGSLVVRANRNQVLKLLKILKEKECDNGILERARIGRFASLVPEEVGDLTDSIKEADLRKRIALAKNDEEILGIILEKEPKTEEEVPDCFKYRLTYILNLAPQFAEKMFELRGEEFGVRHLNISIVV